MDNNFTIKSYQSPEWMKDWIWGFAGYRCEDIDEIKEPIDRLIIYEDEYLSSPETWHSHLLENKIQTLVVFNDHPHKLTHKHLERINSLPFVNRLRIFCQGHWADSDRYPNIVSKHINFHEHFFSHHFIFILSRKLLQNRRPTKDFLWYTVPKDTFRKFLVDSFTNSFLLENSMVSFGNSSGGLNDTTKNKLHSLEKKYGKGQWTVGLQSYGNGLPNMKAYELCMCEVVIESFVEYAGSWLLSEKFFRPISFGMPIILLCNTDMFEKIKEYGYRFYDFDNFYYKFQNTDDIKIKVDVLKKFMNHIKDDRPGALQEIADYNYNHFWNHRKNVYYDNVLQAWKNLLGGNSFVDNLYNDLDS